MYYDAPAVVDCQFVKQPRAVINGRPRLTQMHNVNTAGEQMVDEQGFAGEKIRGCYYKPEHF